MTRRGVCVHVVWVRCGELRVVNYVSGKGASYRGRLSTGRLPINSPRRYVSTPLEWARMRISEYAGQVGTLRKSIIGNGRNHSSREDLVLSIYLVAQIVTMLTLIDKCLLLWVQPRNCYLGMR